MTDIIQLRGIWKSYRPRSRSVSVLRDLDLDIKQGEFVSVIGTSGEGKSTLLNLLGGLDKPDKGSYLLGGQLVNWKSARQLAEIRGQKVSMVFQSFELIPHWTVLENVEMSMQFHGVKKEERVTRALNSLRKVNLLKYANQRPMELSGGEQQRCAVARALCSKPDVILADEPTGNLDPDNAAIVMELLQSANQQGMTVVLVTHDHQLAEKAQRIAVLKHGRIEWWEQAYVER
jgi:putative ABC transport system ATP-binding protein